jgi:hypothetical protein
VTSRRAGAAAPIALPTSITLPKRIRDEVLRLRDRRMLVFVDADGNIGIRPMNRGGRRKRRSARWAW